MDEELRTYLARIEGRIEALDGRIGALDRRVEAVEVRAEAGERRMMAAINDGFERLINRLDGLEQDFMNTKGFLIGDALVTGRRMRDVEQRLDRLEGRG